MSTPARRLRAEPAPADAPPDGSDLGALEAVSAAVEAGRGLPEIVRAASRALDASLLLADPSGAVLAVAARSPADEQSLATDKAGVEVLELRVADELVGRLRMRSRSRAPSPVVLSLVRTLIASEVDRVRAPERASEQAAAGFLHDLMSRGAAPEELRARAGELAVDLDAGGSVVVVRASPLVPTEEDWRARVLAVAERGARAVVPSALAALADRPLAPAGEVVVLVPGPDEERARRLADGVLRELAASLSGFAFTVGRSRPAAALDDLPRAGAEALLAANVAEADPDERRVLAFEETGAYRLLLSAMSESPDELQRFYAETLEPLVAYDDQYDTDLVSTIEAFLDCDGNVAQTAERLFAHRHTVRYRLERVRELSGLDVGSSDGREKLSLGLKAMRVLGIHAPRGPATEAGAEGGRVPGR
ncbi:MAG TPA: helix-turn-helix domain-containing protein [Solirubrobacteraceae bacterium]|nr:helix-turn-helix domain-containing protein [Solirubrobacteraceae bacterium]